LKSNNQMVSFL